jgi:hypothetical protein
MNARLVFLLSYLLGLLIFCQPPSAPAGRGTSCATVAAPAPEIADAGDGCTWRKYRTIPGQSLLFRGEVQIGAYLHATNQYRAYDAATGSWGEPTRPPWSACACDCCGPNCQCAHDCECLPIRSAEAVALPAGAVDVPADIREWYRNPDGSCVQCSLGIQGVDQNVPAASTLLWDTEYGLRERGGSDPYRVAAYAIKRGLKLWNVTGSATYDWMKWACMTGRGAAIGAGGAHFQSLFGYDPQTGNWYVCNNNSPQKIDCYTDQSFHRLHEASGRWCVVLDAPPHPARPEYVKWWGGYGAAPEVDRDMVIRLGEMVQHVGGDGIEAEEAQGIMQALAVPPDDSAKWFISIITMKDCAPCARLQADWARSPDLQAFAKPADAKASWAHYSVYDKDDISQAWRWAGIKVSTYPTILIQPPRSGAYGDPKTVVFQTSGYSDPKKLSAAISTAIKRYVAALPKQEGVAQRRPVPPPFTPPPKVPPVVPAPLVPDVVVPGPDVPPAPATPSVATYQAAGVCVLTALTMLLSMLLWRL